MAHTTEHTVILSDSKYTAPSLDAENIPMYMATYKTEYGHSAVFLSICSCGYIQSCQQAHMALRNRGEYFEGDTQVVLLVAVSTMW